MVKDREAWHAAIHGGRRVRHYMAIEQQQQQKTLLESTNSGKLQDTQSTYGKEFCFYTLTRKHMKEK